MSRALRAVVREAGWVLRQLGLGAARCAISIVSVVRQRRLMRQRGRTFQLVGEELCRGSPPASLRELIAQCERREAEVREHQDALASKSPALGWLARMSRRVRLRKARTAREESLRKLGEGGASLASPPQRESLLALHAAISEEQARLDRAAQPWRALPLSRRMAIAAVLVLIVCVAFVLGSRAWKPLEDSVPRNDAAAASEAPPQSAPPEAPESGQEATGVKAQERKQDPARATLDFAQQRKAAGAGQWVVYGANPVLARGEVGQWDDFNVGSPVVLKEGNQYRMWYRGCHLMLPEYSCGIGHAVSSDGLSWKKNPRPVLSASDSLGELPQSLTLVKARDTYWMWYSVRSDRIGGSPYSVIHSATSKDGLTWQPRGPALRAISESMSALEPCAFFDGTLFHLWYTDYPSEGVKAVMHLTSADGAQWQSEGYTFLDNLKKSPLKLAVLPDGRGGYRALFAHSRIDPKARVSVLEMLLSADAFEWRSYDAPARLSTEATLRVGERASSVAALGTPEGLWAWFAVVPASGAEDIRLAFLKEGP